MIRVNPYLAALAVSVILLACVQSKAQDDVSSYHVGERVEYKASSYPEAWKPGTVIRVYPQYNQVLVHWDPRPDYPQYTHNGVSTYEQAYSVSDVRHFIAGGEKAAPDNGGNTHALPNRNHNGNNERTDKAEAAAPRTGTGLMTRQEILNYMRTYGYANGQPKKDLQVCRDLIAEIKRRGVKERLDQSKDDFAPIAENGCFGAQDTDVVAASQANVGPPTTPDWLSGTWVIYVIGGTVDTAPGDGYIHRRNESIGKLGFVTINADGTYAWKVNPADPPAKYVKGTWRKATGKEMNLQGGAGLVLQKAAEGSDWLVFKYMNPYAKGDAIDMRQIYSTGGYRRIGWRR